MSRSGGNGRIVRGVALLYSDQIINLENPRIDYLES